MLSFPLLDLRANRGKKERERVEFACLALEGQGGRTGGGQKAVNREQYSTTKPIQYGTGTYGMDQNLVVLSLYWVFRSKAILFLAIDCFDYLLAITTF